MRVGCGVRVVLEGTQPGGRRDGQRRQGKPRQWGFGGKEFIHQEDLSEADLFIGWKMKGESRPSVRALFGVSSCPVVVSLPRSATKEQRLMKIPSSVFSGSDGSEVSVGTAGLRVMHPGLWDFQVECRQGRRMGSRATGTDGVGGWCSGSK